MTEWQGKAERRKEKSTGLSGRSRTAKNAEDRHYKTGERTDSPIVGVNSRPYLQE